MILILTDKTDVICKKVATYLNVPYVIIYSETLIRDVQLIVNFKREETIGFSMENGDILNVENINYIWFRKGILNLERFKYLCRNLITSTNREIIALKRFFNFVFDGINHLALPKHEFENNKVFNLYLAKDIGLLIPYSAVLTKKSDLLRFYSHCNSQVVTKGISTLLEYKYNNFTCTIGTVSISYQDISLMDDCFFPSFFQKEIKKAFEIRSFYFLGKSYSIAIMSQENEKTKLDFRDYSVFTRVQRYQLPSEIEMKVKKMMEKLGMKIGVLDFIYGEDGNIYFLEINPTGQINRISELGNYQLDKIIANHLNQVVNERN
ncbi:MAG: hypothetical protein EA362_00165 [Saprospirales bacterium]|jgi:hypothetical protein|nr:MAG: hypothetical protein EA362_00165 [Saprospirales bacterium]